MLAGRFLSRVPESESFPVWDEWLEFGVARGTNASDTLNSTSTRRKTKKCKWDIEHRSWEGFKTPQWNRNLTLQSTSPCYSQVEAPCTHTLRRVYQTRGGEIRELEIGEGIWFTIQVTQLLRFIFCKKKNHGIQKMTWSKDYLFES